MSTIIRINSPFFIRTPQESNINLDHFNISIQIYEGLSGASAFCSNIDTQYSLNKKPLTDEGSVSFDISQLVKEALVQKYNNSFTNSAIYASAWVIVITQPRDASGAALATATTFNFLAQEGYNLFSEGVNYTDIVSPYKGKYMMISENYMEYYLGENLVIPIQNEEVSQVKLYNEVGNFTTITISDNGQSRQKIKYVETGTSTSVKYVGISFVLPQGSTSTYPLKPIEECKYPVHKIIFLNRWGALQQLFFFKKSVENIEIERDSFQRSIFEARKVTREIDDNDNCVDTYQYNVYDNKAHAKKTFLTNGRLSRTLNTGYVNELSNVYFQELLLSEYIWMVDLRDNITRPVNVTDSSFTYKTSLNEKLINYSMTFEESAMSINNIK
jgi:hypothetical protein